MYDNPLFFGTEEVVHGRLFYVQYEVVLLVFFANLQPFWLIFELL